MARVLVLALSLACVSLPAWAQTTDGGLGDIASAIAGSRRERRTCNATVR